MSDPGDKTRKRDERGPLPRTNRPRPGAAQRHTPPRTDPGGAPPPSQVGVETPSGSGSGSVAGSAPATTRSLDVNALTEAAPPTERNPSERRTTEIAFAQEEGGAMAERPTQLDTGRGAALAGTGGPDGGPLKQVPLLRADGTPAVAAEDGMPASTYVGCVIDGRYRIEGVLGRGGMGVVYRARHEIIDKLFAVKILLPTEDTEVVERFVNEARAATAIGNAHIVDTVDFGELPDGSTYFVMEYLEGQTLARRIKTDGYISVARTIAVARQIAEGMGAAHRAGIVHRDLKPENIFLTRRDEQEDFVKLLDFGIAKIESSQNRITRAGTIFGTPHYMSPEQASGSEVDARTDLYAVGVILYEMLSGRVPFDAENPMGLLTQHLYSEPVPLERLPSPPQQIPSGLDAIVLKCLAKKPDDRYESMADFTADLDRVHRGEPPEALADLMVRAERDEDDAMMAAAKAELSPRAPLRTSPLRRVAVAAAVIVLAALGFVAFGAGTGSREPAVAPSSSGELPIVPAPVSGPSVALVFSPIDGEVFRNGRSLGGMPVTVHLAAREIAVVEIRRDGFYPETIRIDGTRPVMVVRLTPIPGVQPRVPVPMGEPLEALRRSTVAALLSNQQDAGGPRHGAEHADAGSTRAPPRPAPLLVPGPAAAPAADPGTPPVPPLPSAPPPGPASPSEPPVAPSAPAPMAPAPAPSATP